MNDLTGAISSIIDRGIGVVSPRWALKRRFWREQINRAGHGKTDAESFFGRYAQQVRAEMYAAAKNNRLSGFTIGAANVNDIITASSPALRSRMRQLVRDFPYLARAVGIMVDYSIGTGIVYQSKVKDSKGRLNKKIITKIEDAVKWWMDEADASGKMHYYDMMRLAKRQDLESGEFVIVKTYPKNGNLYIPYALQMYEADWLTSSKDNYSTGGIDPTAAPGKTETRNGIEYEKLTGRVTGYWFRDPNYGGSEIYVSAQDVVHGYEVLRPQQKRGVTPFAAGIMIASDISSYLDTEIDTSKLASKYLAFIYSDHAAERQANLGLITDTGTGQKIENIENAIIEYLRPGEKIELANSNRPGTTFQPFTRMLLTMLSIVTGAPYELISGDYQGLNYSTARIVRNDFAQQLRPISVRHIRQFAMPTIRPAIDMAVMTGKLSLPGYWQNQRIYWECEYQPPGMDAVDPLREAKSQIESISFGLKSPQEVARERGRDLEEVYKEIALAREMATDMGLKFKAADTSEKNNPAAVMNEEE